jgi:hypothetical protein
MADNEKVEPKQQEQPKERDWYNRVKPAAKVEGERDWSGNGASGAAWSGRSWGGGRER